jgi:DNA-binding transcriptional MerR regulator
VERNGGLRIGELARLAGVTARTIRHYEQEGLLETPGRTASGYRVYPTTALVEVAEIRRLRDVGLSVGDIAALRNSTDSDDRFAMSERLHILDEHLAQEIDSLVARRQALRELRDRVARGDAVLAGPAPPVFDELEQALRGAGVSGAGIDEERRVWAALDSLGLPDEWSSMVEQGVRSLIADPEMLQAFGTVLDQVARLRSVDRDGPAFNDAIDIIVAVARRFPPGDALGLIADPPGASIIHAVARCFTATQQEAFAAAFLQISQSPSHE